MTRGQPSITKAKRPRASFLTSAQDSFCVRSVSFEPAAALTGGGWFGVTMRGS